MPIDPIKIPQNVYIEDRIVGPLTLKQILIVAAGGGFSYAMYAMLTKATGGLSLPVTVIVWIPAAISAVFAFVKINDLSMLRIVFLMLERVNKPVVRTWAPRKGITINIRTFSAPDSKQTARAVEALAQKKEHRIDELSSMLDVEEQNMEHQAAASHSPTRPVDPARVSAPINASVSIFRDISPAI